MGRRRRRKVESDGADGRERREENVEGTG